MDGSPDNGAILKIRARQELQELEEIRRCLDDARVRDITNAAVRGRLSVLIDKGKRDLNSLLDEAHSRSEGWDYLDKKRAWNGRIKRESLALVLGALVRNAGLDGGIGRVTDLLFASLSERTGISVQVAATVGDSEFLDRTVELARLRFPDTSVWGLPIMAHEFGHYVARALPHADPDLRGQVWPLAEALAEEAAVDAQVIAERRGGAEVSEDQLRAQAVVHLNEIFADVYATYALGASYALAVIVLRATVGNVNGTGPSTQSESHPSWARRVLTMSAALRRMSSATDEPRHRLAAEGLVEPLWTRVAGAEGRQDALMDHVEPQARLLVDALIEHAPQRLRSTDSGQGPQLRSLLTAPGPIQPQALPEGSTLPQVIEAAWKWRASTWHTDPETLARVSQRSFQLAQLVDL